MNRVKPTPPPSRLIQEGPGWIVFTVIMMGCVAVAIMLGIVGEMLLGKS